MKVPNFTLGRNLPCEHASINEHGGHCECRTLIALNARALDIALSYQQVCRLAVHVFAEYVHRAYDRCHHMQGEVQRPDIYLLSHGKSASPFSML